MKKSFLKTGAMIALLLGSVQAANFTYNAYGGFISGTQRGSSGGVDDIHFTNGVVMPDSSTVYRMVDWGFGGSSHLELIPESGTITSNGGANREIFGTIIHHNEPINSGSSLEKIEISWHLNLQSNTAGVHDFNRTWSYELHNWETPNAANPCPRETNGIIRNLDDTDPDGGGFPYLGDGSDTGSCDDAHAFVDAPDQNYSWIDGGTVYRIELTGFYDALNNLKQTFWAEEDADTNGTVQFSITEVGPANVSIGDRVWIDSDHDGIQDANETGGVPYVQVDLYYEDNDTVADTVSTDINGTYRFFDVNTTDESTGQPISYYIKFTLPIASGLTEFSPQNNPGVPLTFGNDSDVDASGVTDPFTVDANTTAIDAGVKCGSIGNLVWIDKNRNGLQDPGEPGIEGVQVNLYNPGDLNRTVSSSDSGLYGCMPLGSGDYVVEFVLPSGYHFSPYRVGGDDNIDSDANVTDGKTRQITLDLNSSDPCHYDYYDAGIYPDYNITKEVNVTTAVNGDQVMYTITVTNGTERNATDVNVSDENFPNSEMIFVSDSETHGEFDEGTGVWVIGLLEAGETAELNVTVTVDTNLSSLDNNACIVSEQVDIEAAVCDQASFNVISPAIDIDKSTNGGDGLTVETGSTVTWEYNVTNTGDVNLTNVVVSDDEEGTICTIPTLAAGASDTCEKNGTAEAGQYDNNGTVTADVVGSAIIVSDWDVSSYFAETRSIRIEKSTNGMNADTGTGPQVLPGSEIIWEYVVTNTSNVTLTDINVTDDREGDICVIQSLAAGASHTCEANGTAIEGQYANIGTVTAMTPAGAPVTDSDPSHYLGNPDCPCNDIESDSSPAMNKTAGALMMLLTIMVGLFFVRREEQLKSNER